MMYKTRERRRKLASITSIISLLLMMALFYLPTAEARIITLPDTGTRIGLWSVNYKDIRPYIRVYRDCFKGVERIDFFDSPRYWRKTPLCGLYNYKYNRIWIFQTNAQLDDGTLYQCLRHELRNHHMIPRGERWRVGQAGNIWDDPPLTCENSPFTPAIEERIWKNRISVELR